MESRRAVGQRESIRQNGSPWLQHKGVGTGCEMLPRGLLRMNRPLRSACPGNRIPLARFSGEFRISPSPPSLMGSTVSFLSIVLKQISQSCGGWEWLRPPCYLEVMALSPSADKALSCCFLPLSSESLLRQ